eukprot:403336388
MEDKFYPDHDYIGIQLTMLNDYFVEEDNQDYQLERNQIQSTISYLRPVIDTKFSSKQHQQIQNILTPTTATQTQLEMAGSQQNYAYSISNQNNHNSQHHHQNSNNNGYHSAIPSTRIKMKEQINGRYQSMKNTQLFSQGVTSPRLNTTQGGQRQKPNNLSLVPISNMLQQKHMINSSIVSMSSNFNNPNFSNANVGDLSQRELEKNSRHINNIGQAKYAQTPKTDSQRSLINMHEIHQAENFEKDLSEIMGIVNGVEKDLNSAHFMKKIKQMRLNNNLNQSLNLTSGSQMLLERRRQSQQNNDQKLFKRPSQNHSRIYINNKTLHQSSIVGNNDIENQILNLNQASIDNDNQNTSQVNKSVIVRSSHKHNEMRDSSMNRSVELKKPQNFKIRKNPYLMNQLQVNNTSRVKSQSINFQTSNRKKNQKDILNETQTFQLKSPQTESNIQQLTNRSVIIQKNLAQEFNQKTQDSPGSIRTASNFNGGLQQNTDMKSSQLQNLDNLVVNETLFHNHKPSKSLIQQSVHSHMKKPSQTRQKVVMQVNKYIPHFQRFMKIHKADLIEFQNDYEYEQNQRIQNELIEFDQLLISFFNHRKHRYFEEYYKIEQDIDNEMEDPINSLQNFDLVQKEKEMDEDLVRQQAYNFQLNNIKNLRQAFQQSLINMIQQQDQLQEEFSKERQIFLKQAKMKEQKENDLISRIAYLEQELQDEKQNNIKIIIEEQISSICDKAMFNYELQSLKLESELKQINNYSIDNPNNQSSKSLQKIVTKEDSFKDKYNEVKQQLQYEKKLNEQVLNMMENKVSELLAENGQLKNQVQGQEQNLSQTNGQCDQQLIQLESLQDDNRRLMIQIDTLELQNRSLTQSFVSKHQFETVTQDLKQSQTSLQSLQLKYNLLLESNQYLKGQLLSLKNSISWVLNTMSQQFLNLSNLVNEKQKKQGYRIENLTRIYKETLLFTNKSYFAEEVSKLRREKNQLSAQNHILEKRVLLIEQSKEFEPSTKLKNKTEILKVISEEDINASLKSSNFEYRGRHVKEHKGFNEPNSAVQVNFQINQNILHSDDEDEEDSFYNKSIHLQQTLLQNKSIESTPQKSEKIQTKN